MSATTASERAEIRAMARELAIASWRRGPRRSTPATRTSSPSAGACSSSSDSTACCSTSSTEARGWAFADLLATIEELAVGDGGIAMCVLLCNAALATLTDEQLADVPAGARWALVPAASGTEVTISGGQLDGRRRLCARRARRRRARDPARRGPSLRRGRSRADAPGLRLERDTDQMGLCAAPAASIEMAGIGSAAPTAEVNGSKATASVASALALLRAGTAAIAHGIARRAYEMALEYAQARRQGGVAIIEHDAVSDMLAAMAVRLGMLARDRHRSVPDRPRRGAGARREDRRDRRRGREHHRRRAGVRRHRLHGRDRHREADARRQVLPALPRAQLGRTRRADAHRARRRAQ